MENIGLVLEGGGMRGVFTSGVLDYFMEKDLYFPYVIAVSAGANNAVSYLARQQKRNRSVFIDFVKDPRYMDFKNVFRGKSIFGMDFIFDEIPDKLCPLDYETFEKSKEKFIIGVTDCNTGKAKYVDRDNCSNYRVALRASSSLPFIGEAVKMDGLTLFDGGIADSIPILKAIEDGNEKNVVILTRNNGYRKKPIKYGYLIKRKYQQYPNLVEAILNRYKKYNNTLDYVEKLEDENKIFVIRPIEKIIVGRMERNQKKLAELYMQGYKEAEKQFSNMKRWMAGE
ncbi:MAG: patatin family protein [Eubacteriales bacterium]